jgi:hypothetical protein
MKRIEMEPTASWLKAMRSNIELPFLLYNYKKAYLYLKEIINFEISN